MVRAIAGLTAALVLQGCTYGFLYSDTIVPLDENMQQSFFRPGVGQSQTKQLQDPFVTGITIQWASRAIGDATMNGGIEKVEFADMHTISVLGGLFETSTVTVYGEPPARPASSASSGAATSGQASPPGSAGPAESPRSPTQK